MTLRELYSSNNSQRDCWFRPASLAALGEGYPPGNEAADFAGEALEVALLVGDRAAPVADDSTVPGNDAFGRNAQQLLEVAEKTSNAAVKDRQMRHEQEVAGEQG